MGPGFFFCARSTTSDQFLQLHNVHQGNLELKFSVQTPTLTRRQVIAIGCVSEGAHSGPVVALLRASFMCRSRTYGFALSAVLSWVGGCMPFALPTHAWTTSVTVPADEKPLAGCGVHSFCCGAAEANESPEESSIYYVFRLDIERTHFWGDLFLGKSSDTQRMTQLSAVGIDIRFIRLKRVLFRGCPGS
jgi:hypothetical protein